MPVVWELEVPVVFEFESPTALLSEVPQLFPCELLEFEVLDDCPELLPSVPP